MNSGGLGLLAVVLFGYFFLPSTLFLQQVVSLSQSLSVVTHRDYWRERGRRGRGRRNKKA
jgi:hypothetical protein